MRLRRFLMTEPTDPPLLCDLVYGHAHAHTPPHSNRAHANATGYLGDAGTIHPAALTGRSMPPEGQLAATNASRRYWLTACSGTRNERPTRIASSSPE